MAKIAAIFDVDHTLVRGPTEKLFFCYLFRHRQLSWGKVLAFLGHVLLEPQSRFHNKSYLAGTLIAEIEPLARSCYQEVIAPRLSARGRECVRQHQAQGHVIVILTGSLYFLVHPLKEELGAQWLIATRLDRANDHFTGHITGCHPRGEHKLHLVRDLAQAAGFDISQSYAYADHIQDVPLLSQVGHPVAVNPGWRLKRLAQRYHWPIRYF
ncbi:MAG: HAD family hydrolase [Deltaproteobacteria bacterium]|nr:HAD family hydrolase [Deltaproteobacteria bacterium]